MKKIILFLLLFIFSLSVNFSKVSAYTPLGNYIQLNGGYVESPITSPIASDAFTFEVWVKPDSLSGQQKILSIGNSNEKPFYEIGINGGSLSFEYNDNKYGSSNHFSITSSGNITAGSWNHIAVVLDPQKLEMFANGNKIITGSGIQNPKPFGGKLQFGKSSYQFYSTVFKGEADNLRISKTVLDVSKNWTDGIYENVPTANESTVLLWKFDGVRGENTVLDSSGKNLNGTMIGGDNGIHYFGILPSPTPFSIQFPDRIRWVLPTLSFPGRITTPVPTSVIGQPTTQPLPTAGGVVYDRNTRPAYNR